MTYSDNFKKSMTSRAQVSLWMIVGILLLLSLFYLVIPSPRSPPQQISRSTIAIEARTTVQQILTSCADTILREGVSRLGLQSGNLYPSPPVYKIGDISVPYLLLPGLDRFPTLEESTNGLELYLSQKIPFCLRKYLIIAHQGWKIKPGTISAQVTMGKTVTATILDTTTFTSRQASFQADPASSTLNIPYANVHEFMEHIHTFHQNVPGAIPISAVAEYASQENVIYLLYDLSPEDLLYEFEFPFSLDQTPYRFLYLTKVTT